MSSGTWNDFSWHRTGASTHSVRQLEKLGMDITAVQEIRWFDIHAPTEEKDEDIKDEFSHQLETAIMQIPKQPMILMRGDLNAKIGRERVYKPTIGINSLHNISNDNELRGADSDHILVRPNVRMRISSHTNNRAEISNRWEERDEKLIQKGDPAKGIKYQRGEKAELQVVVHDGVTGMSYLLECFSTGDTDLGMTELGALNIKLTSIRPECFYTTLDKAQENHQVPMHEDSIEETVFVTPDGHYEYLRVPFGLANAPAIFQWVVNKMLKEAQGDEILAHMDDILIPSTAVSHGLYLLRRVLVMLTGEFEVEFGKILSQEIWRWGDSKQNAFEQLKVLLVKRPVLALYDSGRAIELYTDACKLGITGVLLQKEDDGDWRSVPYFSRGTLATEQARHSFELETLAVVESVKRTQLLTLPVPSPDKGGGFMGEASNLPTVKKTYAHGTNNLASDRTDYFDDDTARTRKRIRKPKPHRVATWNVTSFNNKHQEIIMELENKGIDICAIAETKKKGKGSTRYGNYILIYSEREKNERATSGVGILMNGKWENNISGINYVHNRLLQLTVKLQKSKTSHIISVYAPDINRPRV
ncbi:hypothetical protein HUJ04_012898 [Dendroctonus ponderosae]|nr:hypothetical protein HUJ04_012898 [Dendroctonus ponderosae]